MTSQTQENLVSLACALLALAAALLCLELAKGLDLWPIAAALVVVAVVYKTAVWLFGGSA